MSAMDPERLRMLEDEQQARYLAENPDPPAYEWPLIALCASGFALILVGVGYLLAGWLVS